MVHNSDMSGGKYRRPKETRENLQRFMDQLTKAGFYSCRISYRVGNISVLATWRGARVSFRGELQKDNSLKGRIISSSGRSIEVGDFEVTSSGAYVTSVLPEFSSMVFKWR